MRDNIIIQKIIEFIEDFFRIRVIQYLAIFLISALIMSWIISLNPPEDSKKRIEEVKKDNIEKFNAINDLSWEESNNIVIGIYHEITAIKNRDSLNETEGKIKEIFDLQEEEYELNINKVKKIKGNEYSAYIIMYKWENTMGGESTTKKYASATIGVHYTNKKISISKIIDYKKEN
ncbi:MAG TPA: hypothetical protein DEP72_01140 [Clostridiales bacterium]|nr:MAG: hypothetical protein A2Y18_01825 [Clostridiales bacterium GWD2_32_19]HCC06758.1 hypothetical protein [Clostridiales bacterium]